MTSESNSLSDERRGEIALAFVKRRYRNKGIEIGPSFKRELGNIARELGVEFDEFVQFAEIIVQDVVAFSFKPLAVTQANDRMGTDRMLRDLAHKYGMSSLSAQRIGEIACMVCYYLMRKGKVNIGPELVNGLEKDAKQLGFSQTELAAFFHPLVNTLVAETFSEATPGRVPLSAWLPKDGR